ncbi:FecR domain-containing protein [Bacteriovorax sp. Seq25_V]|uniref:FecR family protein n=1 Tax=Bacteriovorax sp. Seq25_V TaxID=1201288 RepID=UPI00038A35FF|nr:FecR family protein [Bacteriovorax sp. Seq25_V]EQC46563.1 sigma factor regulatory protein, FecR/PupR family [Bacteriovorax sp. Seq25_V]
MFFSKKIITLILLATNTYSLTPVIGKVTKIKGNASILFVGEREAHKVEKGMQVRKDSSILTETRSFVQIELFDKSKINVGASTKMNIDKVDTTSAGFITLLKGNIRSQVEKNENNKEKLYIKTRTAALGVRGTDFQTTFNPNNNITNLITFKGTVALTKVNELDSKETVSKELQQDDVTLVEKAQFSTVSENLKEATVPIKIAPEQYTRLKVNQELSEDKLEVSDEEFKKELKLTIETYKELSIKEKTEKITANKIVNVDNELKKPISGGYVDIKSGIYVPPVNKAENLNKELNIYTARPVIGNILESGLYEPPTGVKVDDRKGLIATTSASVEVAQAISQINEDITKVAKEPQKPSIKDLEIEDEDTYDKYYKK